MNYEHISDAQGNHIIVDVSPVSSHQVCMSHIGAVIVADYQLCSFGFNGTVVYLQLDKGSKGIKAKLTRRGGFESPLEVARELKEAADEYLRGLLDRYHETEVFLQHIQGKK